jgi:hypothetical protein
MLYDMSGKAKALLSLSCIGHLFSVANNHLQESQRLL